MKPIRILVSSPETSTGAFLESTLSASRFRVFTINPGPSFMELAHRAEIAVIDCIDERPDVAQLEIAFLKKMRPKIPIIVISRNSSDRDVRIVEQGIYYYLAGKPEEKLVRVIHAAAEMIGKSPNRRTI